MAIKIVISDTVRFKVKGTINGADGSPSPFDFTLTCRRLDAEQLKARLSDGTESSTIDFLLEVVEDWSGVRDAEDAPLPYSEAALRALLKIPGLAAVAFRAYLIESGAKEKN